AHSVEARAALPSRAKKRPAGPPPAGSDAGGGGTVFERAVAPVPEQHVRAPVRNVEIETPVTIHVTHACATAPGCEVHPRLLRDVLEFPSPQVAIERIPVRNAL